MTPFRKTLARTISTVTALALSASAACTALAATYDISEGSVVISQTEGATTVTQNSVSTADDDIRITQSTETTGNTIVVSGGDVEFTIDDVNIEAASGAAIEVKDGANATVVLSGDNGAKGASGSAGVQVGEDASVVIKDDGDETTDSLTAVGGAGASGIGSGSGQSTGDITITGNVDVTADGGANGSGIGSGLGGNSSSQATITIDGSADVKATGGKGGAGIGTGATAGTNEAEEYLNARNELTVNIGGDAAVNATGDNGAGIGGGNHRDGGTVNIYGSADVTAQGTSGIGSGTGSSNGEIKGGADYNGGSITIGGSSTVTATGATDGAGIGGGIYGDSGTIIIEGSADVTAIGGGRGAGVGSGYQGDANSITIRDSATVNAVGGTKTNSNGSLAGGAGIGGGAQGGLKTDGVRVGRGGSGGVITIKDSATVTATGAASAAGIGNGADAAIQYPDTTGKSATATVNIAKGTEVIALSDGTRFAIDTEKGTVTQEGVKDHVVQGTFSIGVLDASAESVVTVKKQGGDDVRTLTVPTGYRSFAVTVDEAGVYFVRVTNGTHTDEYVVYNTETEARSEDIADNDESADTSAVFSTDLSLADNYYLYFGEQPTEKELDPPARPVPVPTVPYIFHDPVEIPDDDVPTAIPDDDVVIPDDETPTTVIPDDEIPSAVPRTGDDAPAVLPALLVLAAVAAAAAVKLARRPEAE